MQPDSFDLMEYIIRDIHQRYPMVLTKRELMANADRRRVVGWRAKMEQFAINSHGHLPTIAELLVYVEDGKEEETLPQDSHITLEILLSHPDLVKELKAAYQEELRWFEEQVQIMRAQLELLRQAKG
jgi:hypothetical protein